MIFEHTSPAQVSDMAKALFHEERAIDRLDGWFLIQESAMLHQAEYDHLSHVEKSAQLLKCAALELPLSISENQIFAGTQRDAFARSYALINPTFRVESFAGYCDPTAVFSDIEPNEEFPQERIDRVREYCKRSDYVKQLSEVYKTYETHTSEVVYFMEQVTGHVVPDMRKILSVGVMALIGDIDAKLKKETNPEKCANLRAMRITLETTMVLAGRYAAIALDMAQSASGDTRTQLRLIGKTLQNVPASGAQNLYEAIQSFIILWQVMCMEQAPNPFAFSVGNADRIFEPYRAKDNTSREQAAAMFKHLLVFFNVGDRSWAISQNLIVGGRDAKGRDLTNPSSFALMDAYFEMNLPQPILSVKLHSKTPDTLYEAMGRFFFTPGCLTPSLFNDDAVFEVLKKAGVKDSDLADYSIAGCQEPLIMGKDNGNTTNTWLNLAKVLELTLNNGVSMLTNKQIGTFVEPTNALDALKNVRSRFYDNLKTYVAEMCVAGNGASRALSNLPVPFLSTLMGGIDTGYDMRDPNHQGTAYNGSGCLIHGLCVVADSFTAIDCLLRDRPEDAANLIDALSKNFEGYDELRKYLLACPKFGNNEDVPDNEAAALSKNVSDIVANSKNYLGNPFRPDFSTPSTHLLYGYWVGATPDGRPARDMLNYGIDPMTGDASGGLGLRTLSTMKLDFLDFAGGYASHFGVDPKYFKGETDEQKGLEFKTKVFTPLFFNAMNQRIAPFYLYVNVTTPEMLRKVLKNPKKYAPGGVYIMRIHGTFVNFLDLSPAIQEDIIRRLDPNSTRMDEQGISA